MKISSVAALVLALLVSGCANPAPSSGAPAAENAIWVQITRCIRDNGMANWPDPVPDSTGRLGFPADAPRTSVRVQNACRSLFAELPPAAQDTGRPISASGLAELVSLARCLRHHGYPQWPDPDQTGVFRPVTEIAGLKSVLLHPPAACRGLVPQEGIHVSVN